MAKCFSKLTALFFLCTLLYSAIPLFAATPTERTGDQPCCKSDRADQLKFAQRNQAPAPAYRPPSPTYRPPANQNQPRSYQPQQFQQQRQQAQQQMRQRIEQQRVKAQQMQEQRRQQLAAQRARMAQERAELAKKNQEQIRRTQAQQLERAAAQKNSPGILSGKVIGTAGLSVMALAAIPSHLQARLANLTERTTPANDNPPKPAAAGGGNRGRGGGTDGTVPGKSALTNEFSKSAQGKSSSGIDAPGKISLSLQNKIQSLSPPSTNSDTSLSLQRLVESRTSARRAIVANFETKNDNSSYWGMLRNDPHAYARLVYKGDTLEVTDIKRGSLPRGSGGLFLAYTMKAHNIHLATKISFVNIIEPNTQQVFRQGGLPASSTLGRMAHVMAEELGRGVKQMHFREVGGKLQLDVELQQ